MPTIKHIARFNDLQLRLEYVEDVLEKSLARWEYPGQDGATLADMGMKGRTIRFSACFWNDTYDQHKTFLKQCKESDKIHVFGHPAYGVLKGMVRSTSIRHDSRQKMVQIEVQFEEHTGKGVLHKQSALVKPQVEGAFISGQAAHIAKFGAKLATTIGSGVNKALDPLRSASEQFSNLTRAGRAIVASCDTAVSTCEGFLATVEGSADSIVTTIDYGTSLPGRLVGALTTTVERCADAVRAVESSPSLFLANCHNAVEALRAKLPADFFGELTVAEAQYGAYSLAGILEADEQKRDEVRNVEGLPAFDRTGAFLSPPALGQIMTVEEMEMNLALVRNWLDNAVEEYRDMRELQTMAEALLSHVNIQKIDRDRVTTLALSSEMPLHLVLHREGLPMGLADRVAGMNAGIVCPTFSSGAVRVYARQS